MRWLLLAPLLILAAAAPDDERRYMVTGFDRLRVDGPFVVEVVAGSPGATAEGDAKALDRLRIRVEGSTLIVSTGTTGWELRSGERAGSTRIRVSVPSLRAVLLNGGARVTVGEMDAARVDLGLNGAATLTVGAIRTENLHATLTGTGAMTIAGTAGKARVRLYGAGSIDASRLTAREATLISESTGSLSMAVRYTAQVLALGAGTVSVTGNPECTIRGPGPVECSGKIVRR